MKKLLYTFLAVSIIFSACEEEDVAPNTNNNNSNNNNTGTIADVVGIWEFKGYYDSAGNLESFYSIEAENCALQSILNLELDGDLILTDYFLQDEISGPCISQSFVFSYNYINSTTLEFIIPASNCGNFTVTLVSSTEFHVPVCNGDNGSFDGDYALYEKQ